jgi:hypothetical protein
MATVLAGDGAGSTLDADLIDAQDSASFLAKSRARCASPPTALRG